MTRFNRLIVGFLGPAIGLYFLTQIWVLGFGSMPIWLITGMALLNTVPVVVAFGLLLKRLRRSDDFARLVI